MFAQLGSIVFENLMGFTEMGKTSVANYGEHALLDGKPRLQYAGLALDTIDLTIKFHVSFCNPSQQKALLDASKDSGEVLPLLWGNGKVEGSFVITEIDTTTEDMDGQGNVFCYVLRVSLKEYIPGDKLKQEQQTNRETAKAVGNKKPTAQKKKNPSTCPQTVTKIITSIENHAAQIEKIFSSKGGPVTPVDKNKVKMNLNAAKTYSADLDARTKDTKSCASQYPDISSQNDAVKTEISKFLPQLSSFVSVSILSVSNDSFQAAVVRLKAAAGTLVNQSITRG